MYLVQKFGQRKAKSEPDRGNKASFYLGTDNIHAEKRRNLETERQKEYNDFLKQVTCTMSGFVSFPHSDMFL